MNIKTLSLTTAGVALIMLYINFTFLQAYPQLFAMINLFTGIVALGIPLFYKYIVFSRVKKIESLFPKFLMDVMQNINAGMTLLQAIKATKRANYGILNPYIAEMDAKLDWGISFEKVLSDFAEKIGSKSMKRTVRTIIETHRSGGSIATVLEAVAESVQELEKIKKERSARIYSQMINGYVIYLVFLGVMFGLSNFLIPAFQASGTQAVKGFQEISTIYNELFRNLIVIQGIFAGLSIGKMAEGTIIAGLKHALVLVTIGYTAFVLFV